MVILFSVTLLISAALLFFIEPMVGKMILPLLGGTPSVWNTCLVFFQGVLLLGYCYAHGAIKVLGVKRQSKLHIAMILLPALLLPIQFGGASPPPTELNPTSWLLWQLLIWVGAPFFALSASAPLLQKWFASTTHPDANDPYFLYSASNLGSLGALLAYPLVIEPNLDLFAQSKLWMYGYFVFIVLTVLIVLTNKPRKQSEIKRDDSGNIHFSDRIFWVMASLVPASLLLGVTTTITTNIAAVPLLWVIPLALYLITFILVFSKRPLISHQLMVRALPYAMLAILPFVFVEITVDLGQSPFLLVSLNLVLFFIITLVCHGSLVKSRPGTHYLTEFYLWISVGGLLGGVFNAILAPFLFSSLYEYPLMLAIGCAIQELPKNKKSFIQGNDFILPVLVLGAGLLLGRIVKYYGVSHSSLTLLVVYGVPAIICFGFKGRPVRFSLGIGALMLVFLSLLKNQQHNAELLLDRNFFGVKNVVVSSDRKFHLLKHGSTIHGKQKALPEQNTPPLAYYHKTGPLGDVFFESSSRYAEFNTAIIGLGAGAIASYAQRNQKFVFFEIDPMMEQIAKNPRYFSYFRDCAGECRVVLGDGRLNVSKIENGFFQLIILDAFSSDSIPTHLLTYEALQLYLTKLGDRGRLLFHISNRYLDLEQLLANLGAKAGLVVYSRKDFGIDKQALDEGKTASEYVIMARQVEDLGKIVTNSKWTKKLPANQPAIWTDRFSNILSVIR